MSAAAEPTLGEILGQCFAETRRKEEEQLAWEAQRQSARALCHEIAPLIGVSESDVFVALSSVPDNLLHLLCSPQGWTTLAGYSAAYLAAPIPEYRPIIH